MRGSALAIMLASVVFLGCANKTVDNDDAAPTPSSEQIQGLTSRVDGTYCSPIWGVRLTPPGRLDMPGGVVDVALVDGFFLEISGHSSDLALDEAVRDEIEAQPLAFGASPTITVEKVPGARDARRVSSDADVGSSEYPSSSLVLLEYETPVAVGELRFAYAAVRFYRNDIAAGTISLDTCPIDERPVA